MGTPDLSSTLTPDLVSEVSLASDLISMCLSFHTWTTRMLISYLVRNLNSYLLDGFENVLNSFLKILVTRAPSNSVSSSPKPPMCRLSVTFPFISLLYPSPASPLLLLLPLQPSPVGLVSPLPYFVSLG